MIRRSAQRCDHPEPTCHRCTDGCWRRQSVVLRAHLEGAVGPRQLQRSGLSTGRRPCLAQNEAPTLPLERGDDGHICRHRQRLRPRPRAAGLAVSEAFAIMSRRSVVAQAGPPPTTRVVETLYAMATSWLEGQIAGAVVPTGLHSTATAGCTRRALACRHHLERRPDLGLRSRRDRRTQNHCEDTNSGKVSCHAVPTAVTRTHESVRRNPAESLELDCRIATQCESLEPHLHVRGIFTECLRGVAHRKSGWSSQV
jgi:hypothetical protein